MSDFLLYLTNGLVIGVIYALSALGVALIVGMMNVVNFAHGELYVLAGYFSALFAQALGLHPAIAMVLGALSIFLFGLVIERLLIRPTYGNDMYSLIVTFILSIVLQNAYLLIFGPYPQKPPNLITGATRRLRPVHVRQPTLDGLCFGRGGHRGVFSAPEADLVWPSGAGGEHRP